MNQSIEPADLDVLASRQQRQRRAMVGVAVAAGLGGLGLAHWWKPRASGGEPVPGFWGLQWDAPSGGVVRAQAFQGQFLLLNFWATWCPPFIEELPLINAFYRENKANGWQVLALAVDRLEPVKTFLSHNALDFAVGMAGTGGSDLGQRLGNLTGGLPFSVAIGRDGQVAQRKLGRLSAQDLDGWRRLE